jgi:hypothetical protein
MYFPEMIEGPALNVTVNDNDLTVTLLSTGSDYNTTLLEENLVAFLTGQAG